ncbi:MAG: hypothetical protein LC122_02370 [Chitinophagales bacterium]|nr:hypothetical protein [Chitinophagales bacterium]
MSPTKEEVKKVNDRLESLAKAEYSYLESAGWKFNDDSGDWEDPRNKNSFLDTQEAIEQQLMDDIDFVEEYENLLE